MNYLFFYNFIVTIYILKKFCCIHFNKRRGLLKNYQCQKNYLLWILTEFISILFKHRAKFHFRKIKLNNGGIFTVMKLNNC
ncbi:hypothetical protein A0256_21145 [Mucilaginibacter sp. PAMC 26640]|nr:hypothetical protein A0256_21145 [Mucilaginibacter sp. PAMC 26640]